MSKDAAVDPRANLLTVKEAVGRLKVSLPQAYIMVRDGTLPIVRIGRRVLIPEARLIEWIEQNTLGG